jgi:hypothetical protein
VQGEGRNISATTVDGWRTEKQPKIVRGYNLRDIYNMDKTRLVKTGTIKEDPCQI